MKTRLIVLTALLYGLLLPTAGVRAQAASDEMLLPAPPYAGVVYSQSGKANMMSDAKFARHDAACRGELVLLWDDPLRLGLLGDLRWTRLTLDNTPVGDLDVYKAMAALDARYTGIYPLIIRGRISAGLLSDLKEIDGNDARVRGKGAAELPVNEQLSLVLGGAYDEAFGDDEWHLIGGLNWMPAPSVAIELQYPQSKMVWVPSDGLAFTLQAGYAGDNWAIFHEKQEYNLRVKSFSTEVGAEIMLSNEMWLRLFGGWLTDQSVDVWKGYRRPVTGDADDTYFAGIALLWR